MIACLPACQGPANPPRFPPITYEDYLHWWYDANYEASAQDDMAERATVLDRAPRPA